MCSRFTSPEILRLHLVFFPNLLYIYVSDKDRSLLIYSTSTVKRYSLRYLDYFGIILYSYSLQTLIFRCLFICTFVSVLKRLFLPRWTTPTPHPTPESLIEMVLTLGRNFGVVNFVITWPILLWMFSYLVLPLRSLSVFVYMFIYYSIVTYNYFLPSDNFYYKYEVSR